MGGLPDKLEDLITDFMSDSNDTRSYAKSIFEIRINKPNPDVLANKLYEVLSSFQDLNSCTISAILLRKSLINTPFLCFPPDAQSTLKDGLLNLVKNSVDRPINKELCHTVSALAASLLPIKEWPEFFSFLFKLVESDKKRALLIVAYLAQYLGKGLNKLHLDEELHSVSLDKWLHSILLECWETTTKKDVRIAALGAAINFIPCLDLEDLANFQDLLAAMMSTLKNALCSENETMADAVITLKLLKNLAGMKPTFLRKQIVEMVENILLMVDYLSLEKETRRLAIEFVLTLVQLVLTLAKVEKTNPRLLKLGTEFEINMEEMWEDNGEADNYGLWRECVDMLRKIGGRIVWDRNDFLTVALEVLPVYLDAPKEQKRHAALIALSKGIIKWNCWECLLEERDWDKRVAALAATINFIPCSDLLTLMLSTLEDVLKGRDEVMATEGLGLWIELTESWPLNGQIMELVKRTWQIANNYSLNVGTRCLTIELLSTLVEVKQIVRWLQQNVRELCEILMNMLDFDPNADHVYARERSNYWRWRKCLDMLYIAVDGNDNFSVVLEMLLAYLKAPEWQKKHAAFIMLARSIESCRETQVTIENLKKVVPMVLWPFPNAHRYVRCAAIQAIQQLVKHLLRFRLHKEVMRTNFELVMSKILNSFQDDDPVVQNASIDAIHMLAVTFGQHLQVGCHLVLPALAEVMNDSPNQEMRASAASVILVFSEYCCRENLREYLDSSISSYLIVLKEIQEVEGRVWWHLDRGSWHYSLSEAWVEIWRNEERDFSPYLEILMSLVFDAAQFDPHVTRYAGVKVLEKATACYMLCFCVDELTELFVPEIDRVVDKLIPFLKWYHDPPIYALLWERYDAEEIRKAAASAMPKILNSAREVVKFSDPEDYDHLKSHVKKLSDKVKCALKEASDVELDEEVHLKMLLCLEKCEEDLP